MGRIARARRLGGAVALASLVAAAAATHATPARNGGGPTVPFSVATRVPRPASTAAEPQRRKLPTCEDWFGLQSETKAKCDLAVTCCRQLWAPVLVGGAGGALAIEELSCDGDESRACCNAPAYGQTVIATGRLVREEAERTTVGWRLVNVTVCEADGATPGATSPSTSPAQEGRH